MTQEQKLNMIHPHIRTKAKKLIEKAAEDGYKIIITESGRTMERQASLYALGRTKPGNIVTYMSKPGAHGLWPCGDSEYCMAFDIVLIINGRAVWSHSYYKTLGLYGESLGLFWGGRWTKLGDVYHFQEVEGLTSKQIQNGDRPSWWNVTDDISGHWAEKEIRTILKYGLMSGYPDGTFKPDEPLTRAQYAYMKAKELNL